MGFSFFKKSPAKAATRPAATPPIQQKARAASPRSPAPVPIPDEAKESLDFSDFQFSEGVDSFHVEADVDPIASDIEQAAVLYANGQDDAARSMLENAVLVHRTGPGERLWLMLFDLYRVTGQKAAFEALEVDYANAFEKSPPAWRDTSKAPTIVQTPASGIVLFQGALVGGNDAGFAAVSQALGKTPKLRLDLSRVTNIDVAGCARLLAQLQQARKAKREIELLGRDNIGAQLEAHVEPGRAEKSECWLLLLELYQLHGQQEAFEEVAINYAVTFEVSPPSWESKRVAAAEPVTTTTAAQIDGDLAGEVYFAHGDIKASRFSDLSAYVEANNPVLIDCAAVTRMDFISAGALLNLLSTAAHAGKQIVFRHPNHLVAELLGVVGLNAVAQIVLDRH